jgi:hypothetical protein
MKTYTNSNWLGTLIFGMLLVAFGIFANAFIYWLLWDHSIVPACASLGISLWPIEYVHFVVLAAVIACLHTTSQKDEDKLGVSEAWVKFLVTILSRFVMVAIALLITKMML